MATVSTKRINKELADLNKNPLAGLTIDVNEDNIYEWSGQIKAAADSPYKGGTYHFNLVFPKDFPFRAPAVTFKTKIYHPGFDEEGHICIPVLRDQWKPTVTIPAILRTIQDKLNNPSPEDPFDPEIAALLRDNKTKFLSTAKEWVKKYAQ
ncbi:hypothetical protein M422DRAFT_228557 [Sphaerobolus stellatus SS14]|uniref:E2 ubiquitin-conjugating enzyme n=1 Tax=Sphaerobolus stellatus (strain SS14) TaxID=990650 RepID=A0A0C9UN67_SPHS4|nr:hypothetical protein M422DRAFT_234880 [Sphaerobolus stellatus SS14]KIJ43959.1 hypothetical protein M422DRAFT_228557 [Sphaerobolus stellatus SS14]